MNSTNHDKPSSAFLSLEPDLVGESDDTLGTVSVMAEDKDGTGAFLSDEILPALDDATTIEYLYLTFNTPIPTQAFRADLPPSDEAPVSPTPDLVGFTNPLDWPKSRKNVIVALSCVATFLASYATGAYSPAAPFIANELHTTTLATEVGVTTFCFGFALAPMALAPFSEVHGRYPVFAVAGVILTLFQAVCGVVTSLTGMLIARFFVGVGGSVFSTLVAGVISDVFRKEDRNTPMALFSGFVLLGTGLGPLLNSFIVSRAPSQWKWVFWHQVIADFALLVIILTTFNESRGSVILSRKAAALNKWYDELEKQGIFGVWIHQQSLWTQPPTRDDEKGPKPPLGKPGAKLKRVRWLVKEDEERASIATMVRMSLSRPFFFLSTEPIVFFFSLWVAFAWGVLYLTFGSIPLVFQRQYNFDIEESGLVFLAIVAGAIIGTTIGILQEFLLRHPQWRASASSRANSTAWDYIRQKFPATSLESRLYLTCFTAVLVPLGQYLFGFLAHPSTPWIQPAIAIGIATVGIYSVYLATFNYLTDVYQTYASSALAAQSFCRNLLGGLFPLASAALITNLGENASGGLLGGIATVLTFVPLVLVLFGEKIRGKSKFAVSLQTTEG